ncbi:hypothetical protein Dsin_023081 [Dipteronia sinensis]|uniref:TF-B3 domain-containing protein n=1 Tax=Dipteronia sinensis TaxID=43782 RepID=A0AAE0A436_9ROSI|nr:hypothetical protein Dsin_023081 [Dipteronia sinensis]
MENNTIVFSKRLAPTDTNARLAIPITALEHIEGDNILRCRDSAGTEWQFKFYTRPNGQPKPAFTTGWLDFVRAKELRIGDVVTLSKQEDEYKIHAKRAINLMGQEIMVDL